MDYRKHCHIRLLSLGVGPVRWVARGPPLKDPPCAVSLVVLGHLVGALGASSVCLSRLEPALPSWRSALGSPDISDPNTISACPCRRTPAALSHFLNHKRFRIRLASSTTDIDKNEDLLEFERHYTELRDWAGGVTSHSMLVTGMGHLCNCAS